MPLPSDNSTQWPPLTLAKEYDKFREWAAWYSGDPERLIEFYAQFAATGHAGRPWYRFWSRAARQPTEQRARMHVPVAGDIASLSGALLFGEEPKIRIAEAHETKAVDSSAKATEDRLQEIINEGGAYNRLIEAAETAAAMGGVFLRPVWDEDLAPYPLIAVTQTDQAVPTFKHGVLQEVIFWRDLTVDGNIITRHLELHTKAPIDVDGVRGNSTIQHAVYQGNKTQLGVRLSDDTLMALTGLEPVVDLPFEDLDVEYVPNMRPNRLWRASPLGISDFSGSETVLDAIDETYASWMRDIRLAKARIVVPREYLDEGGNFDLDHEIYTPVDMEPGATEQGARSMLAHQFEIRHAEHLATVLELVERTVSNAGYSPQSFGIRIEGRAESGTALRIRENKTFLTQKRKSHWWGPALESLFEHMILIDIFVFGSAVEPLRPTAELSDSITNDPVEMAQTVNTLKSAMAASTLARVKLAQPDLTDDEAQAEADKIIEEEGIGVQAPDPFAIGGGGTPAIDAATDEPGDQAEAEPGESDSSS